MQPPAYSSAPLKLPLGCVGAVASGRWKRGEREGPKEEEEEKPRRGGSRQNGRRSNQ
jgi:hypothetical protein